MAANVLQLCHRKWNIKTIHIKLDKLEYMLNGMQCCALSSKSWVISESISLPNIIPTSQINVSDCIYDTLHHFEIYNPTDRMIYKFPQNDIILSLSPPHNIWTANPASPPWSLVSHNSYRLYQDYYAIYVYTTDEHINNPVIQRYLKYDGFSVGK